MDVVRDVRRLCRALLTDHSFLLVRHPNVLEKLRAEINATSARSTHITRNELCGMKYLQNVLKESEVVPRPRSWNVSNDLSHPALRLYPPVVVNSRTALTTTVLPLGGGVDGKSKILIPKGVPVTYSLYAMHRRRDLFGSNAKEFVPERWDGDMPIDRNPMYAKWGYLPFGGAPRTCLGSKTSDLRDIRR